MEINLRKANAIQAEIRRAINAADAKDTVSVTEFTQDIAKVVNDATADFGREVARKVALTNALFNIRKSVGQANATAGINDVLATVQGIDAVMAIYSNVASKAAGKTLEEINARVEKIKNTPADASARASIYGDRYNSVDTSVVTCEAITDAKAKVKDLKRQRQNLQDKLLTLNVNTLVTVTAEDEAVLKTEGIL
jgi:uncharacterized protein YdcH (DUF465 family)